MSAFLEQIEPLKQAALNDFTGAPDLATLDQARSLIMLREAQRTLAVVPAHDDLTVQSYVRDGFLHDGFVEVSATP